jgi:threonylcarbamoyladenosine tRNA methylthiotransferase MtaB
VFPYSVRSGTTAAKMPAQVPYATKHGRMQRMLAVARESQASYLAPFAGRVLPVLWERSREDGDGAPAWDGLTENYIRVHARSERDLRNRLTPALLVAPRDGEYEGEAL